MSRVFDFRNSSYNIIKFKKKLRHKKAMYTCPQMFLYLYYTCTRTLKSIVLIEIRYSNIYVLNIFSLYLFTVLYYI